jgi:hypothetical protein
MGCHRECNCFLLFPRSTLDKDRPQEGKAGLTLLPGRPAPPGHLARAPGAQLAPGLPGVAQTSYNLWGGRMTLGADRGGTSASTP